MRAHRAACPELDRAARRRAAIAQSAKRAAALAVAEQHPRAFAAALKREREKRGLDA